MRTVQQAVAIVSYVTGTPQSRVTQIARRLVDDGFYPKSSGRQIMTISAAEVAALMIPVAFAENIRSASEVAVNYCTLPLQIGNLELPGFNSGDSLLEGFAAIMAAEFPSKVELVLGADPNGQASAIIAIETEDQHIRLPYWDSPAWGGWCRRNYTVSNEGLTILRNLCNRPADDGYAWGFARGGADDLRAEADRLERADRKRAGSKMAEGTHK